MALKRKLNLGFGGNPENVNVTALQVAGQIGGIMESRENRYQLFQLVDAGPAVISDVGYIKAYNGQFQATRTIGNSSQNEICGVFTCAAVLLNFTLLKLGGVTPVKSADATINARGLGVTGDTSNNRVILQAGVVKPIGVAQAAQAAGFVSTALYIPYI